jgi:Crp-like helix-turn-helix domain
LGQLGEWVRALSTRVYEFSALKVESRMCAELLRLAETRLRVDNRAIISPPPMHADLASRIGTRREAVTRAINRLSRQGIVVRRRGAWEVADMARLTALATSDGPAHEESGGFESRSASSNEPAQRHDRAHAPRHKLDADAA